MFISLQQSKLEGPTQILKTSNNQENVLQKTIYNRRDFTIIKFKKFTNLLTMLLCGGLLMVRRAH